MKRTNVRIMVLWAILLGAGAASAGAASNLPATGQTTVYAVGDDGTYKVGVPLQYKGNGNGTLVDENTGLMWEMKDDFNGKPNPSDLHDVNNYYHWAGTCSISGDLCGTAADCHPTTQTCAATDGQGTNYTIFQWVAQLNADNFAGYHNWRIPNAKELESILDYGTFGPSVTPAFNMDCVAPCTLTTCSCTNSNSYWSANTGNADTNYGWFVNFNLGGMGFDNKLNLDYYVRAVRGGL